MPEERLYMAVHILLLVVPLAIIQIAAATPLNSIFRPKKLNLSANAQCVRSPFWADKSIFHSDCEEALAFFGRHEANKDPYQPFEFLNRGTEKIYGYPGALSPRKYIYGTCAIVIATLSSFPAAMLPPAAAALAPYPPSDVETFAFFEDAIVDINSACIMYDHGFFGGWLAAGQKNTALGVFIWSPTSFMNRLIR